MELNNLGDINYNYVNNSNFKIETKDTLPTGLNATHIGYACRLSTNNKLYIWTWPSGATEGLWDIYSESNANLRNITGSTTLTIADNPMQICYGTVSATISLPTGSSVFRGQRFEIRNANAVASDVYYTLQTNMGVVIDKLYAQESVIYTYDGYAWINSVINNIMLGIQSQAKDYGIAIGPSSIGNSYGVAIGERADAHDHGIAIGPVANTFGLGVGAVAISDRSYCNRPNEIVSSGQQGYLSTYAGESNAIVQKSVITEVLDTATMPINIRRSGTPTFTMFIKTNSVYQFRIQVSAKTSGTTFKAKTWEIVGAAKNENGTVNWVGGTVPTPTVICADTGTSTWQVYIYIDTTYDGIYLAGDHNDAGVKVYYNFTAWVNEIRRS